MAEKGIFVPDWVRARIPVGVTRELFADLLYWSRFKADSEGWLEYDGEWFCLRAKVHRASYFRGLSWLEQNGWIVRRSPDGLLQIQVNPGSSEQVAYGHTRRSPVASCDSSVASCVASCDNSLSYREKRQEPTGEEMKNSDPEDLAVLGKRKTAREVVQRYEQESAASEDRLKQFIASCKGPRDLEKVWRESVRLYRPGGFLPVWGRPTLGRAKNLMRDVPDLATRVPELIKDWSGFVQCAEKHYGAFRSPPEPELWYLQRYVEVFSRWRSEKAVLDYANESVGFSGVGLKE